VIVPQGIITAAIERLQSGRLTREQRRAAMLLGGGSVQKGPAKRLDLPGKTKRERKAEANAAAGAMRAAVFVWNLASTADESAPHGRCDCGCGYAFRHPDDGECDHWKGGSSREHTRANGWRLRRECHEEKDGRRPMPPGAISFNARRRAYCERAGIPFVPRKELHHG
jgi:hypothetical protein